MKRLEKVKWLPSRECGGGENPFSGGCLGPVQKIFYPVRTDRKHFLPCQPSRSAPFRLAHGHISICGVAKLSAR